MGIPVLTCPSPYYAGAISAAILQHAGLVDHICRDPGQLPAHARWLADRYRSAAKLDVSLLGRFGNHQSVMRKQCPACL